MGSHRKYISINYKKQFVNLIRNGDSSATSFLQNTDELLSLAGQYDNAAKELAMLGKIT